MDIRSFQRDLDAVSNGHWVTSEDVPELGDVQIRVRGMSAGPARELFDSLSRAVPRNQRLANGQIREADNLRIMKEVLSKHLLMEIRGLTDGDKPVAAKDVIDRMDDPAYEPLLLAIIQCVQVVDSRRADQVEAAAKN